MKRWLWITPVLFALIAGLAWTLRPTTVAVISPTRGEAVDAVFATGSVEPLLQVPVAPRAGGRIVALQADEGQTVKKGQLLARLETGESDAQLQELAARATQAQLALERVAALVKQNFVSASELDRVRAERDAVRAQIQRVQAQRAYALLLAPGPGQVLRRDAEVGQFVAAGQVLFQLGEGGQLRVSAEVDEEDIPRVQPGMAVLLRAQALGTQVFDGTVDAITPRGDPVARSYRVRIRLPAPPAALRVGMTVDANLIQARRANVLLLPSAAVRNGQVWQVVGGRAKPLKVETGASGNGRTEIKAGLAGDARVIANPEGLQAGQRVRATQ